MGRTLENKQQIVSEIKSLLNDSEMAVVLDYKGLTIKEMSDLRSRLQTNNGICKVTKNSLMRKAIDGDSNWNDLESLLTGTNAFVLIKEDVGGAVKAIQSFQKSLEVNPQYLEAYYQLATTHLKAKNKESAKLLLEKALQVAPKNQKFKKSLAFHVPKKRMMKIEDLYGMLELLTSKHSDYINGSSIVMDGRYSIW